MKVSVVVAVRNAARDLVRCIDSVTQQTWPSTELIIMDGASRDGTVEILQSLDNVIDYWESAPDRGIYHAWNKALSHATGNWLFFLGADDYLWTPDVLERMVPHLASAHPRFRVVYGNVASVNCAGDVIVVEGMPWERASRRFRAEMTIPHQGVMHHRSLFASRGAFDESFRIAGDYDLLLRELSGADALYLPGLIVAGMQVGGYSTTPAYAMQTLREFRRAQRKMGATFPSIGWLWAYAKAWVRYGMSVLFGPRITRVLTNAYRMLSGRPARRMRF